MKAQMKFQKILSLVTLIVAAVVFVYALSFFSGNLSDLMPYSSSYNDNKYNGADVFIDAGQSFISAMEIICIVYFCIIALSYIMGCNSRRNYYVTNYVASGLVIGMSLVIGIYGLIMEIVLMSSFYGGIDWDGMEEIRSRYSFVTAFKTEVSKSPVIFIIGIIIFLIVLCVCAAWVYNLIWKKKLMEGEKALLEGKPEAPSANDITAEEVI